MVSSGAGVWVATEVVRGIQLDGSGGRQVLALVVAGAAFPSPWAVVYLLVATASRALQRTTTAGGEAVGVAASTIVVFTFAIASVPGGLWLSVVACRAFGLPLHISGFWPFVIGALVCYVVLICLGATWAPLTARGRAARIARLAELVFLAGGVGVLCLLLVIFDAIRVDSGPGWRQFLVIVLLGIGLAASGANVVAFGLLLWLVSWFSTGLVLSLQVAGFWTFVLATLLGAAVLWLLKMLLHALPGSAEWDDNLLFDPDPFMAWDRQYLAAAAANNDHPHRGRYSSNRTTVRLTLFERTRSQGDLEEAVTATPPGHPDRAGMLATPFDPRRRPEQDSPRAWANEAVGLLRQGMQTGEVSLLDAAVRLFQQAVEASPADDPDRAGWLSNLGFALATRFERAGRLADLEAAVEACRQAVEATPADDPDRAGQLSHLGGALRIRFERTGVLADLDAAVDASRQAVEASPADDPDRAGWLSNLGVTLQTRFDRTGELADLDAAVDAGRQAVEATSADHSYRPMFLSHLGLALQTRFKRTGVLTDLDAAVDASRQAVEASPADDPDRAGWLSNLGVTLQTRFDRTGVLADLDAAVDAGRQAVEASPPDHPDRARYLSNLCVTLRTRFDRTGVPADLDAAVDAGRQAVEASPPDHPDRAIFLSNLGTALRTRFERTGVPADLDAAVDAGRQAVAASPPDHPDRARYLSNLAAALRTRFERSGRLADLDAAVDADRQAVQGRSPEHPDRAMFLSNLCGTLATRFTRTGEPADLDAAVDAGRQAVAASPPDHPDRAMFLSNLGAALRTRFERSGRLADLDVAVDAGRQAVQASPPDHPDRARYLSNLGAALRTRFERTGEPADLDAAVDAGRQAVAASPADHPDRAGRLANLGVALRIRFERTQALGDLDAAVEAGREAVGVEVASPHTRAVAAQGWGWAAGMGGRWEQAVAGFTAAAGLLGELAPRELSRSDQEGLLAGVGGLGRDGAVCAVRAGDPARAVELFEQGRGVLLGQALDTRGDLSELQEKHEALYDRFVALAADLDRPETAGSDGLRPAGEAAGGPEDAERRVRRRRALRTEFDRLVAQIRDLPGFEGFLQPPPLAELTRAAAGGPVVVVAVSWFGSYALVLTEAGVAEPIKLAGLTPDAIIGEVGGFLTALETVASPDASRDEQKQADARLSGTLRWLWDHLAGPVLNHMDSLNLLPTSGVSGLPRLWWCLSAPLSFLPVHAAGRHETRFDPRPCTVIDRVVSSYTPTLRALIHARRAAGDQEAPPSSRRVAAVAMPHTPGDRDLPGAEAELDALRRRLPGRVSSLVGPQARWETVQAALRDATWAHFACHGHSDLAAPSASRLLLYDHRDRPFTVVDVSRLRLDHAHLAYLSACSTARPGGEALIDEAIHLASAFQLAGYRHVIGTLWPIDDAVAVGLADDVYAALTGPGSVEPAVALHVATRRLRNLLLAEPSRWASHIHSGI